ncbi:MAG: HAMP domain-containing histidine kinase [Bacteroidetes bacterium]|nr:HAMP domain-containing histidine kinase [Bacteroidota bacterium]
MKFLQERSFQFPGKIDTPEAGSGKESPKTKSLSLRQRIKLVGIPDRIELLGQKSSVFLEDIKSIGLNRTMDDLERRKLSIFNQLNFFQLITGFIVPITFFFGNHDFPVFAFIVASLPALVSFLVLCLNFYFKYQAGMIAYFLLYPVVTSIVYMHGMNLGVDLFFILYGVLSVFFLQEISHMLFSVTLSMVSYFILAVINKNYTYQLQTANLFFYLFNQLTAIVFIFYGLFLIKKENTLYQFSILTTNKALQEKNREIEKQKEEIEENAKELVELNSLKNKLFSVIAHDLKSPMYALRNLFSQMQQQDLPLKEIKSMIPDVVNDLNYTTGLMENLLQWAKSQMQSSSIKLQPIDVTAIITEVINTLHLQAVSKQITIKNKVKKTIAGFADMDMVQLVLRNLLSNAIKFTPAKGQITISADDEDSFIKIGVEDTGIGITEEEIAKINENSYYTTKGTASEAGTGLGLMLCKEFIIKNGGRLHISSKPGKGSIFSFTLPKA